MGFIFKGAGGKSYRRNNTKIRQDLQWFIMKCNIGAQCEFSQAAQGICIVLIGSAKPYNVSCHSCAAMVSLGELATCGSDRFDRFPIFLLTLKTSFCGT